MNFFSALNESNATSSTENYLIKDDKLESIAHTSDDAEEKDYFYGDSVFN